MKKFFLSLLSVATMFAMTSCSQDLNLPSGEEALVTITANLGEIGSRATEISDGKKVNEVAWAVYLKDTPTPLPNLVGTLPITDKAGELTLRLTTGRSYDIALFAYHTETPCTAQVLGEAKPQYYQVDWNNKKICLQYPSGQIANDTDDRDCFCFVRKSLDVNGQISETFTLKRPLAQLNFGSSKEDYEAAVNAGVVVTHSSIVAKTYTQYDLFEQKCLDTEMSEFEFKMNAVPNQMLSVAVDKNNPEALTDFHYLGTVYLLVNNNQLQDGVKLTVYETKNNVQAAVNTVEFGNVPFEPNWRTNIIGNVLTDAASFNIIVDDKFANHHNLDEDGNELK